jgi:hypothetical protein
MDADNPVVALCARGMDAEVAGPPGRAKEIFEQAWSSASDDYEHCVAAHYVARHQDSPQQRLEWNERCLALADAVGDDRVSGFYPSLHLNLGRDFEHLGDIDRAREHYAAALAFADRLGDDGYGHMIRAGVQAALVRLTST